MPRPVSKKIFGERSFHRFPRFAGALSVLFGIVVVIGWHAHWTSVVEIFPAGASMPYNTAWCLIFCGTGLMALTTRYRRLSPWLGGIVTGLAVVTLVEFLSGTDLGISSMFFRPDPSMDSGFHGRMSPLTAGCLICIGGSLVLTAMVRRRALRLAGAGLLACAAAGGALVVLFGYIAGIESAYGLWTNTRMAIHTAVALILLGSGMFLWAWQRSREEQFSFLHWVPLMGSLTLMVMITVVTVVSFGQLNNAIQWRTHSDDVLNQARKFSADITSVQRGLSDFMMTGRVEGLGLYRAGVTNAPQKLAQLQRLTADNPMQQEHLRILRLNLDDFLAYAGRLADLRGSDRTDAAVRLEATGAGFTKMNKLLSSLELFTETEHTLLESRSAIVQDHFSDTARLLVLGTLAAAGLLLLANITAGREARRRGQVEDEQLNLTGQLAATTALQNAILSSANYAIISMDTRGVVTTFNAAAERWIGYLAKEVVGKQTILVWHDQQEIVDRAKTLSDELGLQVEPGFESFVAKARLGGADENEWTFVRKDGKRFPVSLSVTAMTDNFGRVTGFLGVVADITERKIAEHKIAESLREKEALLREIHHRVKNNMQVISSLLQLQVGYIEDLEAQEIFRDCQNRIRTMALIHEKLYRSEGMARIDFKDYLESLISMLLRSQSGKMMSLRHELRIERIMLDVDTAIPLGLIANELISNCLKHAFSRESIAVVQVVFQTVGDRQFEFVVHDNGRGLPDGFDPDKTSSLGMRLVKVLSEQIKGSARFESDGGTKIVVTFSHNTDKK
jgi:PAS domain S-box-containing protein